MADGKKKGTDTVAILQTLDQAGRGDLIGDISKGAGAFNSACGKHAMRKKAS